MNIQEEVNHQQQQETSPRTPLSESPPLPSTTSLLSDNHHDDTNPMNNNNNNNNTSSDDNNKNNNITIDDPMEEKDEEEEEEHFERPKNLSSFLLLLKQSKTYRNLFKKFLGLLCILVVVILWTLGGEAIQLIYSDMDYEKPFLVTYISTSLFSIYLLGFIFVGTWRRPLLKSVSWLIRASLNCCLPKQVCERMGISQIDRREYSRVGSASQDLSQTQVENQSNDVDVGKTFRLAVIVTFFWFFSNTAYNYALLYTSVASDTIISNTSCLFTFLVGLLIGVETHFSVLRFIAILVTLSGVALVTLSDSHHNGTGMKTDTVLGNMLSLLAAMGYGIYSSILKKYEENVSMAMMFGFVGILNLFFNWPILFILWGLDVETFELPSWKIFFATVVNSLISAVLSDLLWALAVVLTSPVIATVGLTLTIPFAIVCDMLIRSDFSAFNVMYAFGTLFVLFGFIAVNTSYYLPKKARKYDQPYFCSVAYLVTKVKPLMLSSTPVGDIESNKTIRNSNNQSPNSH
ncbi:predicted protein [Naegleria gruberi]|uniref:Predicted protein n=1 Tax=Naegleria gruberi TaxID=5762 RepID=D2VTB1_NAEGR|nr:uncharacterized protein NAEGRDRAFT_72237 [Naegleria gruberi]EFC39828.1 predicted protein [Naegleria gruberi]|eukprot:XP_002672572.1 predicted protein [Naegleria gruberi strain NEG-M]